MKWAVTLFVSFLNRYERGDGGEWFEKRGAKGTMGKKGIGRRMEDSKKSNIPTMVHQRLRCGADGDLRDLLMLQGELHGRYNRVDVLELEVRDREVWMCSM
jgi:hypothetical protein